MLDDLIPDHLPGTHSSHREVHHVIDHVHRPDASAEIVQNTHVEGSRAFPHQRRLLPVRVAGSNILHPDGSKLGTPARHNRKAHVSARREAAVSDVTAAKDEGT